MNSQQDRTVAVFGATGHTAQFVLRELLRRGLTPIAIGRDARRLSTLRVQGRALETRVASVMDAASLDRAFAGAGLVLNCAGPFADTAEAVIASALRLRMHYLDFAAEQASTLALFDTYGMAARAAGIVAMPAMGFYGGLGDLLATAAAGDWTSVDEVRIAVALDSWHPTPGTRVTAVRSAAHRLRIAEGRLAPLAAPAQPVSWCFPQPYGVQDVIELPFAETIVISRHLQVRAISSYMNLTPLADLRDASTPAPVAVGEDGRSAQRFVMEVVVREGRQQRSISARGRDIYATTAPLMVEAAQRILAGEVAMRGVLAPGLAFNAADFLAALGPELLVVPAVQSQHR